METESNRKVSHVGEGMNINGKFNIDIEKIKEEIQKQAEEDQLMFKMFQKKNPFLGTEKIRLEIPGKFKMSFSVEEKEVYSEKDIVNILKEVVAMLESPTLEDKEIF